MPVTVPLRDNFNRAVSNNLGVGWTADPFGDGAGGTPSIFNNTALFEFYRAAYLDTLSLDGEQDIEVAFTVAVMPSGDGLTQGLGLVQQPGAGTADGYVFAVVQNAAGNETIAYSKYTDGIDAAGATGSIDVVPTDLIIFRRTADTGVMRIYRDRGGVETLAHTVTDTSFAGPFFPVLAGYDTGSLSAVGDFYAGNVAAGGATSTILARIAGAWVEKPVKVRVAGAWFPA
jgi:hypothetical protein